MPCLVRVVVLDKSEAAAQSPREASFARQPQEAGCTARCSVGPPTSPRRHTERVQAAPHPVRAGTFHGGLILSTHTEKRAQQSHMDS